MEFTLSELEENEVDSEFDKQPAPLAWLEGRGGRQRVEIWECHLLDVDEAKVQCFDSLLHNAYVVTSYSSSTVLSSSNSLTVSYPSSLQRDGSNDSRRTSAGGALGKGFFIRHCGIGVEESQLKFELAVACASLLEETLKLALATRRSSAMTSVEEEASGSPQGGAH
uniref:Uncharacterized protein n=1 Tax=Oryza sativa subsp. japonica TaxID=39947 RepID=Q5JCV8_ORYSJ|nr:hypothetical protein [Oryza sativa Japonica Group]